MRIRTWPVATKLVALCIGIAVSVAVGLTALGYTQAAAGLKQQAEAALGSDGLLVANQVVGLGGTTHVRVGIRCASSSGCQADWTGGHGVWANLRDVTVVVQDDQAPSVSPTRGALLTGYYAQQIRRDTVPGVRSGGPASSRRGLQAGNTSFRIKSSTSSPG